jgi:hypothetical protein
MIVRLLSFAAIASSALAAQPSAPEPVAAPLRDLQWGQLNVLHTSDTHGWLGGHLEQPSFSADWGDYISFAKHLRDKADRDGVDLLLVDTGDRVEGNGLYDASDPRGKYIFDIFKQQDIDLICSGNHELYKKHSAIDEYYHTVPNFKDNYLATNLDIVNPETGNLEPLAQRYKILTTKNLRKKVLAFGFLFNFEGNANNTVVRRVEDVVEDKEFQDAIRLPDIDVIIVIGHSSVRGDEYALIYKTIRSARWDIPIQFFGGHTHTRDFKVFDGMSTALESGRYMETIGFLSISGLPHVSTNREEAWKNIVPMGGLSFSRRYIDNNLFSFRHHANVTKEEFDTPKGTKVTNAIDEARKELELDTLHGCAPLNLWVNRAPYPGKHSMFTWLEEQVLPDQVGGAYLNQTRAESRYDADSSDDDEDSGYDSDSESDIEEDGAALIITNTGALRFDIFAGQFTRDTAYLVSPFTSGFRILHDVPYSAAQKVVKLLNSQGNIWSAAAVDEFGDMPGFDELMQTLHAEVLAPPEQLVRQQGDEDAASSAWPADGLMGEDQIVMNPDTPMQQPEKDYGEDDDQPSEPDDSPLSALEIIPGYTTKDDAGDDGDDTEHEAIKFYHVPNCIQAKVGFPTPSDGEDNVEDPEEVDLLYNSFIEPWIIRVLRFLGEEYDADDAKDLDGGKRFTEYLTEWVEQNWEAKEGKCEK